jgi:phage tail sheath protein FI
MPVQVSYPGVYIQEVPSGVHTITGVSTSIAAFFGRTARGPLNKAVRCLSLADFTRAFGGPHPQSDLGTSVRQFFDNGGTDCYIVRLASAAAQAADVTLTDIAGNGVANRNVLTARAKTPGEWGNGVRLEVDYNTSNPDETFNLSVIQTETGAEVARERFSNLSMDPAAARFAPSFVTQSSALIDLFLHADAAGPVPGPAGPRDITVLGNSFAGYSQSRGFITAAPIANFRTEFRDIVLNTPNFEINVDERGFVPISLVGVFGPVAPAVDPTTAWTLAQVAGRIEQVINQQLATLVPGGASITVQFRTTGGAVNPALPSATPNVLRITAGLPGLQRSVRVRRAASLDFAAPMLLGVEQGGVEPTRYSNYRPVPTAAYFRDIERVIDIANLQRDQITSLSINGAPNLLPPNLLQPTAPAATDLWFINTAGSAGDGVREKLRTIVSAINNNVANTDWRAELWGYHLALVARTGSANSLAATVVSAPNALLGGGDFTRNVRQYSLGNTGTSGFQQVAPPGAVGIDGGAPGLAEFIGNQSAQTGFYALDPVDIFNLMVIPADEGISEATHQTLWGPASNYCLTRRAFLIIDAPPSWTSATGRPTVVTNTALVSALRTTVVKDYSAVFYPRLQYVDPATGLRRLIGPGGAIAGLMARIDSSRGVWKAPAGTEADLRGIVGLEVPLTDLENGVLNKIAVNCLRSFPSGLVNWGARTMFGSDDDGSEWKYIPIRRLALFLEESLFRGTKWVVFEPNDEPLWSKIRLNLNAFMMSLFRQGAFQGSTPDKAFYVKCDAETTTQNDRNLGIVNIEVGFAPLKPAEFVIIKIQQIAGDL